jgi:pyridoxine kinase
MHLIRFNSPTIPVRSFFYDNTDEMQGLNELHPMYNFVGYPSWGGRSIEPAQLMDVFNGLLSNQLTDYSYVLTGYIGSSTLLEHIMTIIRSLKGHDPSTIYVCDPVLGDEGRLYVAKELIPLIRHHLVPLADMMTPNQYELE